MSLKIKKTTAKKTQTTSEIDPFDGTKVPLKEKRKAADEIGELLVDAILGKVGDAKSPLAKYPWPKLSKAYKAEKTGDNLPGIANMENKGDMLDALTYRVNQKTGNIELGFFKKSEAGKADGHNNFSGKSQLPLRRFLPGKGDKFKADIQKDVDSIVRETIAKSSKLDKKKLEGISSRRELLGVLREEFPGSSETQIIDAIIAEPALLGVLDDLGLLSLLRI